MCHAAYNTLWFVLSAGLLASDRCTVSGDLVHTKTALTAEESGGTALTAEESGGSVPD